MSFLLRRPLSCPSPNHPLTRALSTTPAHRVAKMTIVGRLADDPEEVPTSSGNHMIKYALGTSTGPKDNRTTSWWKVACFPQSDGLKNLMMGLGKGSMVYVEGEASMRKFTTPENEEKQALSIVQRQIDILEKREPGQSETSDMNRREKVSSDRDRREEVREITPPSPSRAGQRYGEESQ